MRLHIDLKSLKVSLLDAILTAHFKTSAEMEISLLTTLLPS